ncbi:right-handed parallel beta-helix repeat-containing protein [Paenibacillus sp. GCM10023248]|uniref:right-handed parallel beta-helix repeat-containing protein n=1 Tax=unclassified Paenibacillus TaxID=185978 RepID=UPI0023798CFD|nr:right-handed parallel beta-helix repeat-containing protein [Paenibacillus sp. MAHUQ-63]MDD9266524.1 right-handed parallel beta-helix repeat-containing protein [Paenibacillus sp. MAHUQ-63]
MRKILIPILLTALFLQLIQSTAFAVTNANTNTNIESAVNVKVDNIYNLELSRWNIFNDGTHAVETTNGINKALKWAQDQGYKTFKVPAGTYLIAKGKVEREPTARINMVSDMTFLVDDRAIIKKETSGFQGYQTLYMGREVHNVIIKGGVYQGDKLTHDYTTNKGTHEGGHGIVIEGATNITIDGVKTENFTGDGMFVGGWAEGIGGFVGQHFQSGAIDDKGNLINDSKKQRTVKRITLGTQKTITFNQSQNLPNQFHIYFYKQDGTFISSEKNKKQEEWINVPAGANYFSLVFDKPFDNKAYILGWTKDVSRNITIQNSESSFNRRQGITIAGVDSLLVINNKIHDTKGTAPSAGIDVESEGFFPDTKMVFRGNHIYNNSGPSIVVCDGSDVTIDGNRLESTGVTIWGYIKGATVVNNTFENSGLHTMTTASIRNNTLINSNITVDAAGTVVDGVKGTDGIIGVNSPAPFTIEVSNVNIKNTGTKDAGLAIWKNPVRIKNVTFDGPTKNSPYLGDATAESIFENFKILNNNQGVNVLPGTYTNCTFELTGGLQVNRDGKFVLDNCTIKGGTNILRVNTASPDVTVQNSNLSMTGNAHWVAAIYVEKAKNFVFKNNTVNVNSLTQGASVLRISPVGGSKPTQVLGAALTGNTITTNMPVLGIDIGNNQINAPSYQVGNNKLYNAKIAVKTNDVNEGNQLLTR